MKNDYVLNHDFGYGKEEDINWLKLRNIQDLRDYIFEILKTQIVGDVKNNKVRFLKEKKWIEVVIEKTEL